MNQTSKDVTKIITAAARTVLAPMGLTQRGRSRTWIDDHGWWVLVVEFQPSGWSKGSYLNVGCCWLWQVKGHLSFDEGDRVLPFRGFQHKGRFESTAEHLAQRAADSVDRYRALFPNVKSICSYYAKSRPVDFWTNFSAGVACGLSHQEERARQFLSWVIDQHDDRQWAVDAREDAKMLNELVGDPEKFRTVILERIRRTRELLRLPPASSIELD